MKSGQIEYFFSFVHLHYKDALSKDVQKTLQNYNVFN